jgi:peroxiredoxin Q/BCP
MATPLKTGDRAPHFELPSQTGDKISLTSLTEKGPVVVYFYPKDETPGCTKEACAFRDSYDVFQGAGAAVVGISSDSVSSHQGFAKKHGLPFLLLSDASGEVRKAFGVPSTLGLLPGRMTFVIDRDGVIQHTFNSQLFASKHVQEAITVVRKLAS